MTTKTGASELAPVLVPVARLTPMEGNPRRGDVEAVARSYARFGQRKPIVAWRDGGTKARPTGIVIAGNHQLAAAVMLGWPSISVAWFEGSWEEAQAYALADNRTSDLAINDDNALLDLLKQLDDELLEAASFTQSDLDALLVLTTPPDLDNLIDGIGEPDVRDGLRRVVLWLPPEMASELNEAITEFDDDEHAAHKAIAEAWLNGRD